MIIKQHPFQKSIINGTIFCAILKMDEEIKLDIRLSYTKVGSV